MSDLDDDDDGLQLQARNWGPHLSANNMKLEQYFTQTNLLKTLN